MKSRHAAFVAAATAGLMTACGSPGAAGPAEAPLPPSSAVYVFNAGNRTVSVVNPATDAVIKTAAIGTTSRYPSATWGAPSGYVLLPHGGLVSVLNVASLKVVRSFPIPVQHGAYATETIDGQTGLVALPALNQIYSVNLDAHRGSPGQITGVRLTGAMQPGGIAADASSRYLLVPGTRSGRICVLAFHTAQTRPLCTVTSPVARPYLSAISKNSRYYAVTGQSTAAGVAIYQLTAGGQIAAVGDVAHGLTAGPSFPVFTPDSRHLVLINRTNATLTVIDPATLKVTDVLALPTHSVPTYAAFSPDGQTLFVTLSQSNQLAAVNVSRWQVVKTINVGPDPVSVIAGSYRFVASSKVST